MNGAWGGELPPGTGQGVVVLPWLVRVGPGGTETCVALLTGCDAEISATGAPGKDGAAARAALLTDRGREASAARAPGRDGAGARPPLVTGRGEASAAAAALGPGGQCVQLPPRIARLNLPGPVRWILGMQASGGRGALLQVLLAGPEGTRLVTWRLPAAFDSPPPKALLIYPVEHEDQWQLLLECAGGDPGTP